MSDSHINDEFTEMNIEDTAKSADFEEFWNNTEQIISEVNGVTNEHEDSMDEESTLDEYEEASERITLRKERRIRMQKSKQRQLMFRKMGRIVFPVLGAVLLLLIIVFGIKKMITDRNIGDIDNHTEETAGTFADTSTDAPENSHDANNVNIENITDLNSVNSKQSDADESKTADSLSYIDSDFGPFATEYSEEKNVFFEGYKVKSNPDAASPSEEDVYSTYAVLVDAQTGDILVNKGASTRINPASMTKILTVLVAAEHVTNLDDKFLIDISITDFCYRNDCSAVGFARDEVVTVRDLMYGTILPSGADAAMALAEYVAGSEDRFVDMMNDKLKELGLSSTSHFTNCVGIYNEDHYTTLTDMAMIMKAAVENKLAREVLTAHKYTTSSTPEHEDGIQISNWFLRRIEDKETRGEVICAKTGFVNESGCCAASYEKSDAGGYYICVTADTWSSWRCIYDHVAIYDTYVK